MLRSFNTQSPVASSLGAVHCALDLAWDGSHVGDLQYPVTSCFLPQHGTLCLKFGLGWCAREKSFVIMIMDSPVESLQYPTPHRFFPRHSTLWLRFGLGWCAREKCFVIITMDSQCLCYYDYGFPCREPSTPDHPSLLPSVQCVVPSIWLGDLVPEKSPLLLLLLRIPTLTAFSAHPANHQSLLPSAQCIVP